VGVCRHQCHTGSALNHADASAALVRPGEAGQDPSRAGYPQFANSRGRVARGLTSSYSASRFATATRNSGLAFSDGSIS
jgi:hypothetical protein